MTTTTPPLRIVAERPCTHCNARGYFKEPGHPTRDCSTCHGTGQERVPLTIPELAALLRAHAVEEAAG